VAGDLDEDGLLALLETWANDPAPDLTVILDIPPARARERWGDTQDRIEARGLEFQERVADGYRRFAARAARVAVVDALGTADEVAARVLAEVRRAHR